MECNLRARAREVHGHGDQLLTLLKVRAGSRVARAAWADPLPVCTRLSPEGQIERVRLAVAEPNDLDVEIPRGCVLDELPHHRRRRDRRDSEGP